MSADAVALLEKFAQRDFFLLMLLGALGLLGFWSTYMYGKYEKFVDDTKQRDRFRQFMSGTGEFREKTDGK